MKKRIFVALLFLMVTVSIPFLTAQMIDSQVRDLKRFLKEEGYALSVTDIPHPNAFSADSACEIRLEPENGVLQILSFSSPQKRESGVIQWLDFWNIPQNVTAQAEFLHLYETENTLIWYRSGNNPVAIQDYLESVSLYSASYISTPPAPAAQIEVRDILHDLQELGYQTTNIQTAGNGTEEYEEITGTSTHFSADAICVLELEPGEGKLLFHEYASPELRTEGAKAQQNFYALALLASGVEFYETEYTLVTFLSPPEQAKYGDPVREYFETLMEELLQK
ncbi:MAG: hypothetical protein ACOX6P_02915 [Candidatus Merdivicinus sp.]|jgi:hypothetical protein